MILVKYIGKRERYTEGAYGSKIEFTQGQTQWVPDELAAKLLKHPDQYVKGDQEGATVAVVAPQRSDEDSSQDVRDSLVTMDVGALADFAMTHYQVKLDKRKSADSLREEVTRMIDQFGVS